MRQLGLFDLFQSTKHLSTTIAFITKISFNYFTGCMTMWYTMYIRKCWPRNLHDKKFSLLAGRAGCHELRCCAHMQVSYLNVSPLCEAYTVQYILKHSLDHLANFLPFNQRHQEETYVCVNLHSAAVRVSKWFQTNLRQSSVRTSGTALVKKKHPTTNWIFHMRKLFEIQSRVKVLILCIIGEFVRAYKWSLSLITGLLCKTTMVIAFGLLFSFQRKLQT